MTNYRILAVNPGSTSTKVAVFQNEGPLYAENIKHPADVLARYRSFDEQVAFRGGVVRQSLLSAGLELNEIHAFSGRGGGIKPCLAGTYEINDLMLRDIAANPLEHPSKLSPFICRQFADAAGGRAYIVSSPHTDEYEPAARLCGIAGIERICRMHALNQKEVALRVAREEFGRPYHELNFIVGHLGGGISIAAHRKGRMVDSNDVIYGDGPMSPNRCGGIDVLSVLDMLDSGRYNTGDIRRLCMHGGGLLHHLGTSDGLEIENMVKSGDKYATLVFDAMIHQIAKQAGAMAAVLAGKVDAIILSGGLMRDAYLAKNLTAKISFIAPVITIPGEYEMEALSNGALRVLTGQEEALVYTGEPVWRGVEAECGRISPNAVRLQ